MFLGVDGGGTKTAFALIDGAGHLLARHESGSAYYLEAGLDATRQMLQEGISATLAAAGKRADELSFAFLGLPSYGEDSSLKAQLDALPAGALPAGRWRCGNDMVCGWSGSLACQDGINIVAGTGSIAYGEFAGRSARAGGWGDLFSDEGSAFWIAREGLTLFSTMSDGRAARGPLHGLVRQHFGLSDDLDLCAAIYGTQGATRSWVAQLAQLVFVAAEAGDSQATAIYTAAGHHLAAIVAGVFKALAVPSAESLTVSYSGGVFKSGARVLKPFEQSLAQHVPGCVLTQPRLSPVIGAALYAARCGAVPLSESAVLQLERTAQ